MPGGVPYIQSLRNQCHTKGKYLVVVIFWTECMLRKFGNEIRLPGTTGIDNLPIPLTLTLSDHKI